LAHNQEQRLSGVEKGIIAGFFRLSVKDSGFGHYRVAYLELADNPSGV